MALPTRSIQTGRIITRTRTGTVTNYRPTQSVRTSERIVGTSRIPYMRQRTISFTAQGMRPGVTVIGKFDGKTVALSNSTVDSKGSVSGTFRIPAGVTCGTKRFELYDAEDTTGASATYTAQGTLKTKQKTITTVRGVVATRTTVTQQTTQRVLDLPQVRIQPDLRIRWKDPIAQSFLVNSEGGAFLTKIDAYFKTKDTLLPVSLYIVEMENGMPTSNIVPFSEVTLDASEVSAHTTNPELGKTTFTFSDPVYLEHNTEYAFVLFTNSKKYEAWISTLGDVDIATGKGIAKQPYMGSMFKSQNSSTWTADQLSDIKFRIHKAVFKTGTNATYELQNELPATARNFSVGMFTIADLSLPDTYIDWQYKFSDDVSYNEFTNRENIFFSTEKNIDPAETSPRSLLVKGTMTSENPNISPVIDYEQMGFLSVQNELTGDAAPYNAGTYVSGTVNLANPSDDLRVMIDAIKPGGSEIDVYFKTSQYIPKYISRSTNGSSLGSIVQNDLVGQQVNVYYYNSASQASGNTTKYGEAIITAIEGDKIYVRSVSNIDIFLDETVDGSGTYTGEPIAMTDILLTVNSGITKILNWGAGTSFSDGEYAIYNNKLWQRVDGGSGTTSAPSILDSVWDIVPVMRSISAVTDDEVTTWRKMKLESTPGSDVDTANEYVEYVYVPELEIENEFASFAIKIELKAQNSVNVPRVKDMRALAVY